MTPRFGEPPQPGRRYKIRPGAYAILARGTELLLTHQADPEPEFQLPGGGIDPRESPVAALMREVVEETGWRIAKPQRVGVFRRFVFMPEYDLWAEKICTIYSARPVYAISAPTEAGHQAVWVPYHKALSVLGNPGDRAVLQHYGRASGLNS